MEAKARDHETKISKSSGKDALQHAITAAELYMKAVKEATDASDRARLKAKCEEVIARAEKLKSPPPKPPSTPRVTRELPTGEKAILLRSSRLHGNVFPPWEAEPETDQFATSPEDGALFEDASLLSFSGKQLETFAGWKRPSELFPGPSRPANENASLVAADGDCDLVQDITTDCSVVASLCAVMKHLRPKSTSLSLLSNIMFPFDHNSETPAISPNGKYIFRMHFNGCFRRVIIDDRLPSSKTSRTLFVVDRRNPRLIWPALLEKAYLKIRGGYDFPGSNSGTDLWVLTGWIPEQIFLQSDDIELDQTWNRIKKAYDFNDVVVTLGTGRLSPEEEETLGLAGEHDYAVLDLAIENGVRRMLLKNPWCEGLTWTGVGSSSTVQVQQKASRQQDKPSIAPSEEEMTGTFWISLEDVVQNFESLYLNWNPSLFTRRQDHHFVWDIPPKSLALSFARNPQYSMRASADGPVWILLSRHFQDEELAIARNRSATLAEVSNSLGFMSLYVFDAASGGRVQLSDRPRRALHHSHFVDSPQTLLRIEARRDKVYTIAAAQSGLPLPRYSFTLSFFSRCDLTVEKACDELAHYQEHTGSWTRRTAGGNPAVASYLHNPQLAITLPRPSRVSLLLCTDAADIPVHVDLVWAQGQRVTALAARDVALSSGEYRRGCCLAETPQSSLVSILNAGTYTAVLSTFEPGMLADYTLRIGSDEPLTVAPVPADGAGRLRAQLPPVVLRGERQHQRRRARLSVTRLTRVSVVARSGLLTATAPDAVGAAAPASRRPWSSSYTAGRGRGGAPCAVRISLERGTGPHRHVLAASGDGEMRDAAMGLRAGDVDFDAAMGDGSGGGGLWLVVEQMGAHAEGYGLQVDVLSDQHVEVGPWESWEE
ncbi:uncharacterized protein E0L32_007239 [Thyridium curvatum]|uniref:Calpain catalytic domain-containing protein n=1 Tax=Thyridium curvatum TaxID=1093900 RepID=A0A507B082_9PEZI|nr:uncharacterized protein E0L32_007239 [Thyridium curvatum]TPX12124.1 hypothetical protein E0L32_007239 [Thyridium curvatum]